MFLARLNLREFRNYEALDLSFGPNLNVFFGPNAAGKTNILEAIYCLGTGHSLRASHETELIRRGAGRFLLSGELVSEDRRQLRIDISLAREAGREIRVNGVVLERLGDLLGKVPVIAFSPDDLQLVKGGPAGRRRFLDQMICQLAPVYYAQLVEYWRTLNQRNRLLKQVKQGGAGAALLDVWDEQLARAGAIVSWTRLLWAQRMFSVLAHYVSCLGGSAEKVELVYNLSLGGTEASNPDDLRDMMLAWMASHRREEVARGHSLVGPHRDDVRFWVGEYDARSFASQGQQRTLALAARLAQWELLKKETGKVPLLLLDDVFSELDPERAAALWHLAGVKSETGREKGQVFVTMARRPGLERSLPDGTVLFEVKRGEARCVDGLV